MIVRVSEGVTPVYGLVAYRPGDVVELPMNIAYQWVGSGWATEVQQ